MITKSTTAKLVAGIVGFAMVAVTIAPAIASADTASDLQAQINSLLATIQSLQSQLAATTGGSSSTSGSYTFNTNLTVGSRSQDVMNLQKVLNMSSDTMVASSGAGSPGMETMTFGPATKAAVIKFQMKYGITPAAGFVGAITRAKLNSMGGGVTVTPPAGCTSNCTLPTGGALSVYAGTQPSNSLAPQGASRVPFTNITLAAGSADVTVNSITVQRSGLAQDASVAGVVLLDSSTGLQIGIAKTLNSNHQATVGEPFVVKAGTTRMVTVAANMASSLSSYSGQILGLDVIAVNTTASVSGSLPITGAQQTLNGNLTIGTVTISASSFDPNNGASQPIGTTQYRFSGLRITAGSAEDLTFKSIRWNQTGSVGSTDLANVVTVVNGTSYPTMISADGKYYSTVFPTGIVVAKGNSVDVYIQGDIVGSGAAGRTAEFDVYKNTDLYLTGNTYGYGVTAPTGSGVVLTTANHATVINTSSNPWFEGSQMSITAGSVTLLGKANEVASQNIAINVPNQVLGGFATNFSGEPVSVQSMYFAISTSSTVANNTASPGTAITNITLVDQNGNVVAGPVDAVVGDGATAHAGITSDTNDYAIIHFTDTVTFPVGRRVYTIKGKIPSSWTNGSTVILGTKPSTDWTNVTGQTTGNSVDLSGQSTVISMNTMTVKGAAVQVNISAQPAAQFVVGGVQNFVLANYQLDASQSGEDIRTSSFPVKITATGAAADLTGCALWDGSTQLNTGSRVINTFTSGTAKTYSFDNTLTIPKGTTKTLALACNLASSPSAGSFTVNQFFSTATSTDYPFTGITSGNTVTPTIGSGSGGAMTVGSGSFTASVDSSSPATTTVAAGTTGVTMGTVKFRATNENITLTKVGLKLTAVGNASDIVTAYIYNGSTQVGSLVFPQGSNITATSTLATTVNLPANTDVVLTIKADLAPIGVGLSGTEGQPISLDVISAEGSGQSSGSTFDIGQLTTGTAGVRMFKSFPTVAQDTLSSTGIADGHLIRFKITANNAGPVGIDQLSFAISTTSGSTANGTLVTAAKLNVFSDAAYSQAVAGTYGAAAGQFGSTSGVAGSLVNAPAAGATALVMRATTNALQIPAGTTYYFSLDATVATISAGSSVTTTLLGDAAYIAAAHLATLQVSTSTGAQADSNNAFIWSGNATTTATISNPDASDWANGFKILGLPSGGISVTRGN